jgi:hypothetical protein
VNENDRIFAIFRLFIVGILLEIILLTTCHIERKIEKLDARVFEMELELLRQ